MRDRHDDIEAIERQRAHNERMRKAGEQFAKLVDGGADEQREAVAEALVEGLRQKYGKGDDDTPPAA